MSYFQAIAWFMKVDTLECVLLSSSWLRVSKGIRPLCNAIFIHQGISKWWIIKFRFLDTMIYFINYSRKYLEGSKTFISMKFLMVSLIVGILRENIFLCQEFLSLLFTWVEGCLFSRFFLDLEWDYASAIKCVYFKVFNIF